jgi:NAD(P)-dependent dehydrogenase (short-subunit alcohol dehydrogenase family)
MSIALVTGANSGIGKEIARELLTLGHTVYIGARDPEKSRSTVDELGGNARALVIDVTDADSIDAAAGQIAQLDILVNNAGINPGAEKASDTGIDTFRRAYETNVFGLAAVTNAFLPLLRESAHPRIVNVSSGTGSLGWSTGPNPQFDFERSGGGSAAYRSSKAAVNALTVLYSLELADAGIKVNALAPGLRATNLVPALRDATPEQLAAAGVGDPAEVANEVVRLATLPDDGPSGAFFSWDGGVVPW